MTEHVMEQPQTEVSVTQSDFSGAILGLQGDVLHGWAIDTTQQEHRLIVEVLIDGASVALVRADLYEPSAPTGDQFHGFAVQLRQCWLDEARLITAQIANQPFVLDGQLLLPVTPDKDSAGIASQVWHAGGLRIGGWCWDPKAPDRHVEVMVRKGDQLVGRALCNEHSQALAYRATSNHGFAIDLPWELADGKVHELKIMNDVGQQLAGSPIRLCCWPEGIEGLIKQLNMAQDASTLKLLTAVAKEQSIRLPKSAGWESYPQWFEAFQSLDGQDLPPILGKPGVLIISEGDVVLEKRTLESLEGSHETPLEIAYSQPKKIGPAIKRLISSGCDKIIPIHAGDRLASFALAHLCTLLDDGTAWAFSDCDRDGPNGGRSLPWLKPVWDIDLFIGADIFTPGAIFSDSIITEALNLLTQSNGKRSICWDELVAGIALATERKEASVAHLPRVLYHRAYETPASPEQAMPETDRMRAIEWLCDALQSGAKVSRVPHYPALLRAHWPLPKKLPKVSLIVPTRDQYKLLNACIEGLLTGTDYPDLEIIVVDNQSSDPDTIAYLKSIQDRGVRVLRHDYPFNYSIINNRAASIATGTVIGLINNDIEIIESGWLREMISHLQRPNVGAVGAKLLWPNRMVQHGGVVVGVNGLAAHIGNNLQQCDAGYLGTNQLVRRQSAVTAACLLVDKCIFDEVRGLDEWAFPVAFNDVDLCMRITHLKKHIIWTPFSQLIHAESASRGKDESPEKVARAQREQRHFLERWSSNGWSDQYYHGGLSIDYLSGPYGGLSIPPRHGNEVRKHNGFR